MNNFLTEVGLGVSACSNYMRHVSIALLNTLREDQDGKMVWPTAAERRSIHGLVCGFPKCVAIFDGTKQKIFCPSDDNDQDDTFCGQHYFNYYSALVWNDIFGMVIHLNMIWVVFNQDRDVYNEKDVHKFPLRLYESDEYAIANWVFLGEGKNTVFLFKRNQGRSL